MVGVATQKSEHTQLVGAMASQQLRFPGMFLGGVDTCSVRVAPTVAFRKLQRSGWPSGDALNPVSATEKTGGAVRRFWDIPDARKKRLVLEYTPVRGLVSREMMKVLDFRGRRFA